GTRVASGDRSVLAKRRLQRRQDLHCRPGPQPIVTREQLAIWQWYRHDLAIEKSGLLRGHSRVLAFDGVAIHLLSRDPFALGDVLGPHSHRDIDVWIPLGIAWLQARIAGGGRIG